MQADMVSDLFLRVSVLSEGFIDGLVPFLFVTNYFLGKQRPQSRPVQEPLALGNLANIFVTFDVADEFVQKVFFAQENLPFHITPDRLLSNAFEDETTVLFRRPTSLCPKLCQNPVRRETGMRIFNAGGGPVTARRPVFGILYDARTHGVQHDIPADLEKMGILLNQYAFIPAMEEMTATMVTLVERLGINAV